MQTAVLLKYGQKEHLQEILKGNLYLKCIQFFKENGKDSIGRLDNNENLTDVWRYPQFNGKLLLNGMEIGTFCFAYIFNFIHFHFCYFRMNFASLFNDFLKFWNIMYK